MPDNDPAPTTIAPVATVHYAFWHVLHRVAGGSFGRFLVHLGFWSGVLFTLLLFMVPLMPDALWQVYTWVAFWYMVFQLGELGARDSLDIKDILEGHAFAIVPALVALVLEVLRHWNLALPPKGNEVLDYWFAFAWLAFLAQVIISVRILSSPYRRSESGTLRH